MVQRLDQGLPVGGLADAHRGAGAGGLDEHGIVEAALQQLDGLLQPVLQVRAPDQLPGGLGDAGVVHDQLGQGLVHSHSGGGDVGADVGDARQLQQALHGAVLAVLTVHHREHHVDALPDNAVALEAQQALAPDGGDGAAAVVLAAQPGPGGEHGVVLALEPDPVAVLGNTHGVDVVFFLVDVVEHRLGRAQGDLMLRAHAAEENADTKFFHIGKPRFEV